MMIRSILIALAVVAAVGSATLTWKVAEQQFASIAMSVAFTSETTGLAPVAFNGQGSAVLRTTDGGDTWSHVQAAQAGAYLGGDAVGDSAVVASFALLYYSNTGTKGTYDFNVTKTNGVVQSQSVRAFGTSSYGVTGQTLVGGGNGVAVSTDGGENFRFINATALKTQARYGAFPSDTTWYLSAGTWASNTKKDLSAFLSLDNDKVAVVTKRASAGTLHNADASTNSSNGWAAQIVKTTDGGQTWTSVFSQDNEFYFNQIDCASETHCVAVGEADGSSGSVAGIRIYVTEDGGASWNRTFFNNGAGASLMAVRFSSPTEVWASGGFMTSSSFEGVFLHSTDGGHTWNSSMLAGQYPVGLSFPTPTQGYAASFNQESISSFLKTTSSSSDE